MLAARAAGVMLDGAAYRVAVEAFGQTGRMADAVAWGCEALAAGACFFVFLFLSN
jgi:hypothetical protein